jgi:hypothetical protein
MIMIPEQEREELTLPHPYASFARFLLSVAEASGSAAKVSCFPDDPVSPAGPVLSVEWEGAGFAA